MSEQKNRMGRVVISNQLLGEWEALLVLFEKFVPFRIEYKYERNQTEYIGFSPLFDEIQIGAIAPQYNFVFQMNDGVVSLKEVLHVEDEPKESGFTSLKEWLCSDCKAYFKKEDRFNEHMKNVHAVVGVMNYKTGEEST